MHVQNVTVQRVGLCVCVCVVVCAKFYEGNKVLFYWTCSVLEKSKHPAKLLKIILCTHLQ